MLNKSLLIVKPDAVSAGNASAIVLMVEKAGFRVVAQKMMCMSTDIASRFYAEHRLRPFYDSLVRYMCSGPVVVCVLSRDDAVRALRDLIGHTDPMQAKDGTIRKLYGKNIDANAVHASDSDVSAAREIGFFFAEIDVVG